MDNGHSKNQPDLIVSYFKGIKMNGSDKDPRKRDSDMDGKLFSFLTRAKGIGTREPTLWEGDRAHIHRNISPHKWDK